MRFERETVHSITTEAELRADIARTRALGYATTREEMTLGNVSVAAALPRVEGLPAIALGLVVHLERAEANDGSARSWCRRLPSCTAISATPEATDAGGRGIRPMPGR